MPEPSAPRTLLIDLDGVLRSFESGPQIAIEQAAGLPTGAIAGVAFAPDTLLPAIRGDIRHEDWKRQIVARLQAQFPEVDVSEAVAMWSAPAGVIDPEVLAIVRRWRQRMPVALVTNATTRLNDDLTRLGISEEFNQLINSSAIGMIKPEAGIFEAALHAVGVEAHRAVFVDDQAANVSAAERLGITGHHYRDAASLRAALQSTRDIRF